VFKWCEVVIGLLGDPFEGVDTACPDFEQLVPSGINLPELVDGTGEAFGDLSLAVPARCTR
jgi:hypothetical protein